MAAEKLRHQLGWETGALATWRGGSTWGDARGPPPTPREPVSLETKSLSGTGLKCVLSHSPSRGKSPERLSERRRRSLALATPRLPRTLLQALALQPEEESSWSCPVTPAPLSGPQGTWGCDPGESQLPLDWPGLALDGQADGSPRDLQSHPTEQRTTLPCSPNPLETIGEEPP